jgi:hypothetical protein
MQKGIVSQVLMQNQIRAWPDRDTRCSVAWLISTCTFIQIPGQQQSNSNQRRMGLASQKVTETSLLSAFQAVEDERHGIEGY